MIPFFIFNRYNIIKLNKKFIHARLAAGPYCEKEDAEIMIPRIKFLPDDQKTPVEFQRIQYPVRTDFAITSNKSQGRTYQKVGINQTTDCFGHGQFYVAISRVGSYKKVSIFKPKNSPSFGYVKNVVYPEVLSKERIPQTRGTVNSNDVIGRPYESMPATLNPVVEKRIPYPECILLTHSRLDEEGFELREETPADGNCFLHGIKDQMR